MATGTICGTGAANACATTVRQVNFVFQGNRKYALIIRNIQPVFAAPEVQYNRIGIGIFDFFLRGIVVIRFIFRQYKCFPFDLVDAKPKF